MKIKFKKDNKGFHQAVIKSVEDYFESEKISNKANAFMLFKTAFFLIAVITSYCFLILGGEFWVNNILWICLGLSSVFLAVNCGHDAIHGAYSSKKWVNKLMSNSYNLLGANSYMWSITHNVVHHTYTNIEGADEDIESVPLARLSPQQKWRPIQKYQYIWIFFLYPFATLSWIVKKDYMKFFQKNIGNYDNKNHPNIEYFNLFFYKAIYYTLFIVIPIVMIDLPWYQTMMGFILGHFFEGATIAIIFMLAHVVEETQFPVSDQNGNMDNNWAVHQMYTTADFGRKSALTSFFTGGLNFQIEHHLFPKICHTHYPAISEIVKSKAIEYGIPYIDFPSFSAALKSHVNLLKKLGNNTIIHLPKDLKEDNIVETSIHT